MSALSGCGARALRPFFISFAHLDFLPIVVNVVLGRGHDPVGVRPGRDRRGQLICRPSHERRTRICQQKRAHVCSGLSPPPYQPGHPAPRHRPPSWACCMQDTHKHSRSGNPGEDGRKGRERAEEGRRAKGEGREGGSEGGEGSEEGRRAKGGRRFSERRAKGGGRRS